MSMSSSGPHQLALDRRHQNLAFESWRLGGSFIKEQRTVQLPHPVHVGAEDSPSYVHTRATVLRNHLLESAQRLFLFLGSGAHGHELHEVVVGAGVATQLRALAELASLPSVDTPLLEREAALDCSLAVLPATPDGTTRAVVSTGRGDLRLLTLPAHGTASVSTAVLPLRPPPPLTGVRPFVVEAAAAAASGAIRCLVWAVAAVPAACRAAPEDERRCELWEVTLVGGEDPAAAPIVTAAHLLQRSAVAPHAVVPTPEGGGFLAALGPLEEEGGRLTTIAGAPMDADAADDGDVSPRTLEQAAARLAQYTSVQEEAGAAVPEPRWTDVYHESGPDGVGGMGDEPSLVVALLAAGGGTADGGGRASAAAAEGAGGAVRWSMIGGPHRLLAAQQAGPGALLLGVTDDVDCAVLRATVAAADATPEVEHVGSIPALAYVAAGKTQKRHLLLGPPGCPIAAVLVEGRRYAYVYGAAAEPQAARATQEVVDLALPGGATVLGARLVPLQPHPSGGASSLLLLIATREQLNTYRLCAAAG